MPLFEIAQDNMVPFRRLHGGADLYEKKIEDLLWKAMEEMTGETIFPVTRQIKLPFGGIPDQPIASTVEAIFDARPTGALARPPN